MTYREVRGKSSDRGGLFKANTGILADEPSADLDEENVNRVKTFFKKKKRGTAILLATHDKDFAFGADTVYRLKNGVIDKSLSEGLAA